MVLGLQRKRGDAGGELEARAGLARALRSAGSADAIGAYESALALAATIGERSREVSIRNVLGILEWERGHYHRALGHYEAALVLAQFESDAGHHLAAAQLYQELLDSPQAVSLFDPQLSALAAVNHLSAGRSAEASDVLKSLLERNPSASISLGGRELQLPGPQTDLAVWLAEPRGSAR